ncbi:hypothetical protein [Flavobacterium sp. 2]|uniref:hypothetical protein n=1 Tax=Flavobacterium sp. 2 TaxID=308053 RepID=UPI003CF19AF5
MIRKQPFEVDSPALLIPERQQSIRFSLFKALFGLLFRGISAENNCPSPDSSGNPFAFFFKKQKIEADSGKQLLIYNPKFGLSTLTI